MGYLIFGASGFLGSAIVDWLYFQKQKITIIDGIFDQKNLKYRFSLDSKELKDDDLNNLVLGHHTVVDASGISSNRKDLNLEQYLEANARWPYYLAKKCIKLNTRLVWFSTIHCNKYDSDKVKYLDNYGNSKYSGESLIKSIPGWQKKILISRLGNIIGAPGKLYRGNSKLFCLDIASQLVKRKEAFIESKTDNEIRVGSISNLFQLIYQKRYGFINYSPLYCFKLSELANLLKFYYEEITNKKANLYLNKKLLEMPIDRKLSEDLNKDIKSLINYYLMK